MEQLDSYLNSLSKTLKIIRQQLGWLGGFIDTIFLFLVLKGEIWWVYKLRYFKTVMLGISILILYFIFSRTVFQVEETQTSKSLTGLFFGDVIFQTGSISKGMTLMFCL